MSSTPLHLADRYRLYEQIGTGRFATVWLAWDEVLGRLVAVKVIKASRAAVPVFRTRFVEQVRKAAQLSHPAIVTIHDFGESTVPGGVPLPFLVMELLSGESLASRLERSLLPRPEALRLCGQVASALAYAHAAGTAHYDLKPGNVFLTDDGPKVLDFGTGKLLGGPVADATAEDVRALGMLLSATVTGQTNSEAELPHEVATVRVRCLLPDPAARPSAAEVAAVLAESAEPHRPAVPGSGPGALSRQARHAVRRHAHRAVRRSHLRWRAALLLCAIAVATILILAFRGGSSDRGMPPPTPQTKAPPDASRTTTASADPTASSGAPKSPPVSAPTASGPATMDDPKPIHTAKATPPPPTSAADPAEVLSRTQRPAANGVTAGEIRSDVGLDLNNVLGNLRRDLKQNPSVDLHTRLDEIHNKIDTRLGEKALTRSRTDHLHTILNEIHT